MLSTVHFCTAVNHNQVKLFVVSLLNLAACRCWSCLGNGAHLRRRGGGNTASFRRRSDSTSLQRVTDTVGSVCWYSR